jgi:GMP reductase
MPRVDNDIKLDFKDVLFRPKRSTLKSRSQVELAKTYQFRNSKKTWTGVPIMAANMDTVGTFDMAKAFTAFQMFVCIHKHYSLEDWVSFAEENPNLLPYVACSSGTSDSDFELTNAIIDKTKVGFICIDVANGYSEHFVEHVKKVRARHPDVTIIAGNVVTGEMVEELLLGGADIIKIGIGPGSVCTTRKQTGG